MKKFFSLSQCFLLCATLLFSFKSFADCPLLGSGITSSTTCTGSISTTGVSAYGIFLQNYGGTNNTNTVNMIGDVTTSGNNAHGINLYNDTSGDNTNTVNMTGNISTTGVSAYGINLYNDTSSSDNTNTVNMTGNIETTGSSSYGITLYNFNGSNNTNNVNMAGNITTNRVNAHGMVLSNSIGGSNTNTVNMTGNIETTGVSAYGIYLINIASDIFISYNNNINTVNMTGNVTTFGENAYGIYLYNTTGSNNTNTVNMTGDITTSGIDAHGTNLNNSGTNSTNTVNMTGDITTSGVGAHGTNLNNSGTNSTNTVNMTGNISTTGFSAVGINFLNDYGTNNTNTVNMTGNISTTGDSAVGIYFLIDRGTNNNSTVNMTGNISTTGDRAFGIILANTGTRTSNNVNMSGNISTTRNDAYGIFLVNTGTSASDTVNMSGNISTTGDLAYGIGLLAAGTGTSNTVNMSGNITTSGATAHGIVLSISGTSATNTVNMTGRVSATGLNSYAIVAVNDDATSSNTVQLNKGSSVIGGILGSGASLANNFLKLNLGAGASYSFATTGFTVQDLNGRPMVTGSAHAAGVGNITTASQSLYERTSQITQSLDDRLRTYDLGQNTDQPYWINTYYSDSSRGGQGLLGSNLSFNQYRSGITAGFNVENSYTPTELVVNYEYGKLNIDEGNQSIQSNGFMAGVLFPDIKKLFNGTLSAKALVGYSDFNGDRKVLTNDVAYDGSRNVTANYHSTHLTLGSAWTKTLYQTDKIILDTLVGVDLNTQHINSYSESDLFKWSGRTINQLQERVSLGVEIKPLVKPLTLFGRVSIENRDLLSGENQNFTINNTAVSYNDSKQRNAYASINAGAHYPLTPTIRAYAQVRYYDSDKNIDSLSGNFGISGQF